MIKAIFQAFLVFLSSIVIAGLIMYVDRPSQKNHLQHSFSLTNLISSDGASYSSTSSARKKTSFFSRSKSEDDQTPKNQESTRLKVAHTASDPLMNQITQAIGGAAEKILKTVVSISVTTQTEVAHQSPFFSFPFPGLDEFFGMPQSPQEIQGGGSGFIINKKEGLVLTNCHVVYPTMASKRFRQRGEGFDLEDLNNKSKITIKTNYGRGYLGKKVIGASPDWDLAIIQVPNLEKDESIEEASFSRDQVRLGEPVLAAGSPFGLESTVTFGIVSSVERDDLGQSSLGQHSNLNSFIQTDAAINPGNSGGPLVNMKGEVIGVSTALIGPNVNVGIGLAIPSEQVLKIVPTLISEGYYKRGSLGVNITDLSMLDEELRKANGIDSSLSGVMVHSVVKGSSAESAGIEAGDVIYAWNDKPLKGANELIRNVAASLKEVITLGLIRNGKKFSVKVTINESNLQANQTLSGSINDEHQGRLPKKSKLTNLGLNRVQVLSSEEATKLNVREGYGVRVLELSREGGLFKRVDIRPGDVIVRVNQNEIKTLKNLENALAKEQNSQYLFTIYREGAKLTVFYSHR
jgi:S1-C subfamily serine protease